MKMNKIKYYIELSKDIKQLNVHSKLNVVKKHSLNTLMVV